MKKSVIFIFTLFLCTFLFPNPDQRTVSKNSPYSINSTNFGLKGGLSYPLKENYSSDLAVGISADIFFTPSLSVEISGYRFQTIVSLLESDGTSSKEDLDPGTLTAYPIQLSLKYQFSTGSRFVPYIILGGDFVIYQHSLDLTEWENIGFGGENKVKAGIGAHGGLGVNIFVTSNIALSIDARYIYTFTGCNWTFYDKTNPHISISGEISNLAIDFILATAGIKFYL